MMKTLPALAAVGMAALLLVPTIAKADEPNSARVSYADLNLVSPVGQQKLQHRIGFAAKSVCYTDDNVDLQMAPAVRACRDTAVANAQPAYRDAVRRAYHPSVTVLDGAALVVTAP